MFTDPMTALPTVETPCIPVTTSYHGWTSPRTTGGSRTGRDVSIAWTKAQRELTVTYLFRRRPLARHAASRVEQLLRAERTTSRPSASWSIRTPGPVRRDHYRLDRPVAGRRTSRGLAVGARHGGRVAARLRHRQRRGRRRADPAREPEGRLHGLAARRVRILVHPLRRPSRVPAAGVWFREIGGVQDRLDIPGGSSTRSSRRIPCRRRPMASR